VYKDGNRQYSKGSHTPTSPQPLGARPPLLSHKDVQVSISLRLTGESSKYTLTSAQPLGSRPHVLSHRNVLLNISLSHCVSQENHLEYHIISTLCTKENSKPITWAPSPPAGVHIVSSQMIQPSHGHLPFSGANSVSSSSQRE
jgi:hypothetical protein